MFEIVLYQPEIPPNTGNIIRLCANTGAKLHLIEPMGFVLTDKTLKRAGMDYSELACVTSYPNWDACREALSGKRFFFLTTKGSRRFDEVRFKPGDVFVFGPESAGLPEAIRNCDGPEHGVRLPMMPGCRSMNLSNTVAVVTFEAWRQQGFAGGA